MARTPHASMLLLVAVLGMTGICGMGTEASLQHDQSQHADVFQKALKSYPLLRLKRWPVNPWPRSAELQEESYLQPGVNSWMEHPTGVGGRPTGVGGRPYVLVEENGNPYNPKFTGGMHLVQPFENPFDQQGFVVEQSEQPNEEIPLHPSRPLQNPYNQEEFIIQSYEMARQHENPYNQGKILITHHDQPEVRKFFKNPLSLRRPGNYHRPVTIEVTQDNKDLRAPLPASTNDPTRTLPERWNEFVLNSILKLKYGGEDVFDLSELSWIPGQASLSPSMIEDMLRWDQPNEGGILVPRLLKSLDPSSVRFVGHGKWEIPNELNDNSMQIYTVPLSIVRLFHDSLKSSQGPIEPIRQDIKEVWIDLKQPQDSPGEVKSLHLPNRHAVDFRDYHDYDFIPNKELPQKDQVLLGKVGT